ncbi:MAG: TetR/AcrR family transcriptional regulator [Gammaproteobacteria bacterium]|nr:TetR/AcrR family transcriptional regulator [Gammaproteobacteria bacterium]
MPYSKEHKQQSREKILKSAVALFCRKGFNNVSIDDLMKDAKLTRGAFYAHFESKSDVYMQAIIAAARNSDLVNDIPKDLHKDEVLSFFISSYLSNRHVSQECSPCPLAFLSTDVSTNEPKVKKTYTKVFEGFVGLISDNLPNEFDTVQRHTVSHAISALVIGSVIIGRALNDDVIQDNLLESSKAIAMQLTGSEV